jgi:hypothetical protein
MAYAGISITILISMVIGLLFLFSLGKAEERRATAGGLMSALGVLGTFIGIVIGLMGFNPEDINSSLPILLEGMKTAFVTSVVGLGGSTGLHLIYFLQNKTKSEDEADLAGRSVDERQVEILNEIKNALVADEDSSLLTQIQLLRTTMSYKLEVNTKEIEKQTTEVTSQAAILNSTIERIGTDLAENSSKSIVEALEVVVRDFNKNLNEQFGENFKQLNEAVGQMVVWIDKYRSNMGEQVDQIKSCFAGVDKFAGSMGKIEGVFHDVMSNVNDLGKLTDSLGKTLESQTKVEKDVSESIQLLNQNIDSSMNVMNEASVGYSRLNQAFIDHQQGIDTHFEKSSEKLSGQVDEFEKMLEDALEQSLMQLGMSLASLSEKFVNDYGPLTDKLQKLVELSEVRKDVA